MFNGVESNVSDAIDNGIYIFSISIAGSEKNKQNNIYIYTYIMDKWLAFFFLKYNMKIIVIITMNQTVWSIPKSIRKSTIRLCENIMPVSVLNRPR
ncbi:hypothetical protein VEE65_16230 [Escherichia coli]|nr:hypothetical protein VEE65_16230 [Escherichia coli]